MPRISLRAQCAVALLGAALLLAGFASAQDPRASAAQAAARQFVALADRGDAKASWQSAGQQFRDGMTELRWARMLEIVRPPLGAVVDRALLSTEFIRTFPGAAREGDYAIVQFRTSFAKRTGARESLTLEREGDGAWRVVGYVIG
jgi:hypothetical protein